MSDATLGAGAALTFSTRADNGGNFDPSSLISERMRISQAGYVGIGTTAPRQALDIRNGHICLTADYGSGAGWAPGTTLNSIEFYQTDNGTSNLPVTAYRIQNTTTDGDGNTRLEFLGYTHNTQTLPTTPNLTLMNGNVGIGTGSPDTLFHVAGAIKAGGNTGFRVNVVTGTFPASRGHTIPLPSGVTRDQLLFYWGQTQSSNGDWVPWDYRGDSNWIVW